MPTITYNTDFSQIGIYNALFLGMDPTASDNSAAFLTAVTHALAGTGTHYAGQEGGLLLIPSGTYKFTNTISLLASTLGDQGLVIMGTGGSTELVLNLAHAGGDFITLDGFHSGKGIRFENLRISYSSTTLSGTAIKTKDCQDVTCKNVFFQNCPQSLHCDNRSLQCGLSDCTIEYFSGPAGQSSVVLNGSQDFVRACVIRQHPPGTSMPGPSMCTAISIGSASTAFVSDTHIADFYTGIAISDLARDVFISNVFCQNYLNAVTITLSDNTRQINNIHFSDCNFALSFLGSTKTSGVVISLPSGATNSQIAGIQFDNCVCYGWGNAGIEIDGGENITITGGQYSSNGQSPSETLLGAGIAITRGALITISGVDCSGINQFWEEKGMTPITQPCGIAISGGASNITISGCQLNSNSDYGILIDGNNELVLTQHIYVRSCDGSLYSSYSSVLNVSGNAVDIQVTSSAGYNDRAVPLASVIPTSGSSFSGPTHSYYGPVEFYTSPGSANISEIAVDGNNTLIKAGAFTLGPGHSAAITWTPVGAFVPTFVLLGQ